MKVKNWLNFEQFEKDLEINTQPSITIPDQSMTVKQMLERHNSGMPVSLFGADPTYSEDELPDLRKMDLSEIQDLREFIQEKIKNAQQAAVKAKEAKEAAEKAEFMAFRKLKEEQRLQEQQPKPNQPTVQPNS